MKSLVVITLSIVANLPGQAIHYEAPKIESEKVTAVVTAYTSSVEETDETPHLTASGSQTERGIVACPSRLEFGTLVKIEGRHYRCEDRMNARYRDGEYYDIWVEGKEEAFEWGRKELAIEIIK